MLQNLDKILNSLKYSFIVAVSFLFIKVIRVTEQEYPEKPSDLPQVTGRLSHIKLQESNP
jgi:hypothetical protein